MSLRSNIEKDMTEENNIDQEAVKVFEAQLRCRVKKHTEAIEKLYEIYKPYMENAARVASIKHPDNYFGKDEIMSELRLVFMKFVKNRRRKLKDGNKFSFHAGIMMSIHYTIRRIAMSRIVRRKDKKES